MHEYEVGDVVEYRPFGGGLRAVRVCDKDSDIKNGRPGFDGYLLDEEGDEFKEATVWGYDEQIVRVLG